jgi:lipopolysaccharide/colanic/teichoic acid biosynthesis glycosyltransferase
MTKRECEQVVAETEVVRSSIPDGFTPNTYHRLGKRLFDIVFGLILLILMSPLIMLAWVLVRLTTPGAGFFHQNRVGQHATLFRCYKLRSMRIDQDRLIDMAAVREIEAKGHLVKLKNDPRVTRIGKLLRKGSIDELPQLWNVVKGDMSLVGPRPLMPHMMITHPDLAARRCLVKPGITGQWQIKARAHNRSLEDMVQHDLDYINNCSLLNDLRILVATVPVVLTAKGAH